MEQKLGDPINGMVGYAVEDIFEPSEWIDATTLAGSDEAAQHGSGSTSHIAAEEQPVAATDRDTADALFGPVIVDFEMAIFGIASQCNPVFEGIAHSAALGTLGQNL